MNKKHESQNKVDSPGLLVSISCITYNHGSYIAQAMDSFLMQKTNFPIEILVHDDASTDNTADIIREYEAKYPEIIRPIYETENQWSKGKRGSAVFNFPRARGKYIALCEGDDYWTDPYKLQKQVDFLEANEDYSLCFHKIKILLKNGEIVSDFITKVRNDVTTVKDLAMHGNYIHTPSVVLRNDFVIPSSFSDCPIGDYPLYFISVKDKKIKYLHETMAVYRFGVGAHSNKSSSDKIIATLLTMQNIVKNYPDEAVKKLLMKRSKKTLYSLLCRFLLIREGSPDQLDAFLHRYYSGISDKPFYDLATDLIKNWFLLSLVFIKQFIKTRCSCLKKILSD